MKPLLTAFCAVSILLLSVSPVSSQQNCTDTLYTLEQGKRASADRLNLNFLCLAEQIEALKNELALLRKQNVEFVENATANVEKVAIQLTERAGAIPSGAIAAFDVASGCPNGWRDFAEGAGRVIVGSGNGPELTSRPFRSFGGEEKVSLDRRTLPPHNHAAGGLQMQPNGHHTHNSPNESKPYGAGLGAIEQGGSAGGSTSVGMQPAGQHEHKLAGATDVSGDGMPHNNMPPFIVLRLCRKE